MFLSFIIAHYNLERELPERCIGSILQQDIDGKEYEIIVVDDGSASPPDWVEESFPNINITLIKQEHKGLGAARNTGINRAKGQYHLFIDGDDYLYPHSLAPCITLLKEQLPNLLGFQFRKSCTPGMEQIEQEPFTHSYTYSGGYYMLNNNLSGCAWLYIFSRELVQKNNIRFNEGVLHEDEDFTTRIYYCAQTAIHCNRIVYAYYQRSGSIVTEKDFKHLERRFADVEKSLQFLLDFQESQKKEGNITQLKGLERKITMLTADLLMSMQISNMPGRYIKKQKAALKEMGLFPLPKARYGFKYAAFRFFANRKYFSYLLYLLVHLFKKSEQ